jgi:hypothetical protein
MHLKALAAATTLLLAALPATAKDKLPESWDGLVEVNSEHLAIVYLAPGADLGAYQRVMVDPTEVAMRKNWLHDQNAYRELVNRVGEKEVDQILRAARDLGADLLHAAHSEAGYQPASAPAPDVLRISTAIVNIDVRAPDVMPTGRRFTYATDRVEATLVMELRDSVTNRLIARLIDRRETSGQPTRMNVVPNTAQLRHLFSGWNSSVGRGLDALKAHSPLPDPLTPGQKLNEAQPGESGRG